MNIFKLLAIKSVDRKERNKVFYSTKSKRISFPFRLTLVSRKQKLGCPAMVLYRIMIYEKL